MRIKTIILFALVSATAIAVAENSVSLLDLLPASKHKACGLHKLTPHEKETLNQELLTLIAKLKNDSGVAVIAHSVSTRMKAQEIMKTSKWSETQPKKASHVLVVCRSELLNPLNFLYGSYYEMNKDADGQSNISGSNYHVYLYRINDDLSVAQEKHKSFPAGDD